MGQTSDTIRILHVDDDPDLGDLVGTMLEREDERFTVETFTSAGAGLDRLTATTVDCIVSDYDMPGTDGIEFLKTVRREHPQLPFLLYTGKGSEEVASEAIAAGVTDYLQKQRGNEQYELLANRIGNAVEQYRANQRAQRLDRLQTLLKEVNRTLVRADSREEIESRICEILSDADHYCFAWIGDVECGSHRIHPRTVADIDQSSPSSVDSLVRVANADRGLTQEAVRTRTITVVQRIEADPASESWQQTVLNCGFQSMATIPLLHEETMYGVLHLYANQPGAFDAEERDTLAVLSSDIGHALHTFDMQARIRRERNRRRALADNAPTPVVTCEIHPDESVHRVIGVNKAFEQVFDLESAAIVGTDIAERIVPEDVRARHETFRRRALAGEQFTADVERLTADGRRKFILHVVPYGGTDQGGASGYCAWYTDIEERERREQELQTFREAVENAGHAICWTDAQGTIQYVNPVFEAETGYGAAELVGKNPRLLKSGEHDETFYADLWETITAGDVWESEIINERKDGTQYVVEQTIAPITNDDGEVRRFVAVNNEITDR